MNEKIDLIRKLTQEIRIKTTPSNFKYILEKNNIHIPNDLTYEDIDDWLSYDLQNIDIDEIKKLIDIFNPTCGKCIFIIHSSVNKKIAKLIEKSLNSIDIDDSNIYCSSVDECGTKPGNSFHDAIRTHIEKTSVAIYIVNDESVRSTYCQQEIGMCLALNITILPVTDENFNPDKMPGFLDSRYQCINISKMDSSKLFLETICDKCGLNPKKSDFTIAVKLLLDDEYE